MKKSNNLSYNRIIEYINDNPNLDKKKKRILISYATQLNKYNIENKENENIKEILEDIKKLNIHLKTQSNTSLALERFERVLNIFEKLLDVQELNDDELKAISYELDKLYMEMDLKIRKNSSLSYNFEKNKGIRK